MHHGFRALTGNWNDNLLNFIIFIFHKEHIRHRTALTNLRWVAFRGKFFTLLPRGVRAAASHQFAGI
ncbi:Uncharacterised protein [Klebsiella pneumoniae]|nr:Uncharacterised protein [Klebsiella pneumoniae]